MSRRPTVATAVAMTGAALVAGCANNVTGTANPQGPSSNTTSSTSLFQACGKIPDDAVKAVGADPSTAEQNPAGPRPGWELCSWTASWYFLEVVATNHPMDDLRQDSLFHGFKQVELPGRDAYTFLEGDDQQHPRCDLGFGIAAGSILVTIDTKGGNSPQEDPCGKALSVAGTIDQFLPH